MAAYPGTALTIPIQRLTKAPRRIGGAAVVSSGGSSITARPRLWLPSTMANSRSSLLSM
jgi:hypothetical protein